MTPSKKGFALHKTAFVRCGCCEFHHPLQFTGDCRNDANRFHEGELDQLFDTTGWEERSHADWTEDFHMDSVSTQSHPKEISS